MGSATTADNCSVASTTNDASEPFVTGTTIVTWTVTDGSGNTATAIQNVTVIENIDPTITAPADVAVSVDAGQCTASGVALGSETTADNCSVASVTNDSSEPYALGTTIVTWTVTDGAGNTATAMQNVVVSDNIDPTITAPVDVAVNVDAGLCTASGVVLGSEITADNCSVASVTNDASEPYALGTTIVTWIVTDGAGNTATTTQNVVVSDNINPTIIAPVDVAVNVDAGLCTASSVALGSAITGDNCSVASTTNDASEPYALGTTVVTWTVTDGAGNTATASQNVVVSDNIDPTITAPADVAVNVDAGLCTASGVVLGSETTADNCSVASVTNDASEPYALGTTVVTWTVTDGSGNTTTATQNVVVSDNIDPVLISGPDNISQTVISSDCTPSIVWTEPVFSDNCTLAGMASNFNSGDSFDVGSHVVTYTTEDQTGNTATYNFTIDIVLDPEPLSITSSDIYCIDDSDDIFTANYPGGTWSGTGIDAGGVFDPVLAGIGSHNISYTLTNNGCNAVVSKQVEVAGIPTKPTIDISPDNLSCDSAPIDISGPENYTYLWSNNATTQSTTVSESSTITLVITDANGCSNTSDPVELTFSPVLIASTDTLTVNSNDIIDLDIITPVGGVYSGTGVSNNQFDANIAGVGIHIISYTYPDECNNTKSFLINVVSGITLPTVSFNIPNEVCNTNTVDLSVSINGLYDSFIWSIDGNGQIDDPNSLNTQYTSDSDYEVVSIDFCAVLDQQSVCETTSVTIVQSLNTDFTSEINEVDPLEVSVVATETRADIYTWNFGDGNEGTGIETVHKYSDDGSYPLSLSLAIGGCHFEGSASTITVTDSVELFIPKAIYLNSTAANNRSAKIHGKGLVSSEFSWTIFNRWGETLYQTNDLSEAMQTGWNGTFKGKQQPNGVYNYIILISKIDGSKVKRTGSITLFK